MSNETNSSRIIARHLTADETWRQLEARREEREARAEARRAREERYRTSWF